MEKRVWILGASDPEMSEVEKLLKNCDETFTYALIGNERVLPFQAYSKDVTIENYDPNNNYILVECRVSGIDGKIIDHHNIGDPGYGKPASDFWNGSSIGQVVNYLEFDVGSSYVILMDPDERHKLQLVASSDHCLGSAYRGECPGIDPKDLFELRVKQKALFQGKSELQIRSDIENTKKALCLAPSIQLDTINIVDYDYNENPYTREVPVCVKDMRREPPYPELVEAATYMDEGYISGPLLQKDGRKKYTVSGNTLQVSAWMNNWAPANNIIGIYGDPVRGFAGGYLK